MMHTTNDILLHPSEIQSSISYEGRTFYLCQFQVVVKDNRTGELYSLDIDQTNIRASNGQTSHDLLTLKIANVTKSKNSKIALVSDELAISPKIDGGAKIISHVLQLHFEEASMAAVLAHKGKGLAFLRLFAETVPPQDQANAFFKISELIAPKLFIDCKAKNPAETIENVKGLINTIRASFLNKSSAILHEFSSAIYGSDLPISDKDLWDCSIDSTASWVASISKPPACVGPKSAFKPYVAASSQVADRTTPHVRQVALMIVPSDRPDPTKPHTLGALKS